MIDPENDGVDAMSAGGSATRDDYDRAAQKPLPLWKPSWFQRLFEWIFGRAGRGD